MRLGKTLQDVKELSKKQSKKKNYAGWFQSFGGEAPINNVFFNMAMGSADGIAGAGEADGGVGMTSSMGESLYDDEPFGCGIPKDPDIIVDDTSTPYTIESFKNSSGRSYVDDFLNNLDERSKAEVANDLEKLRILGRHAREPLSKHLEDGIFEFRSKTIQGNVRILYFFAKDKLILLTNGIIKKQSNLPKDEIDIAKN